MGLNATGGWAPGLIATAEHVWGGDDRINVSSNLDAQAGWRTVEHYHVAPSLTRARFVLPANSRRAAVASVRSYNQLRAPRIRAARTVLGLALGAGAASLLRARLNVHVDPSVPDSQLDQHVLTRHLAGVLDDPHLGFAIGIHDQTPNSKPTLQAFSRHGTPIAFAKIGWNDVTRLQVRTEAAALSTLAGRLRTITTPQLRHAGSWRDRELMVTAPMPLAVGAWADDDVAPDVTTITEVANAGTPITASLHSSAQLARLRSAANTASWDPHVRSASLALLDRLEARFADLSLRFGAWHGDWVPWNVAHNRGSLVVWDWEQFRDRDVVIGSDSLHWHFQVSFVKRGEALGTALAHARTMAAQQIAEIQGPEAIDACHGLYTLELTARYEAMRAAGAGTTDRFHPQITTALAAICPSR